MPNYYPISSGNAIKIARVTLLPADILALFTTPVMLIPAPGAGYTIYILRAQLRVNFVTTAYVATGTTYLTFNTSNPALGVWDAITFLNATQNYSRDFTAVNPGVGGGYIPNTALYIQQGTANPTLGNSTLDVWVNYMIYPG